MLELKYFYCEKCKEGIVGATRRGKPYRYCKDCLFTFLEEMLYNKLNSNGSNSITGSSEVNAKDTCTNGNV